MRQAGFTLAELLVALVLTAAAVGIVSEGVRRSLAYEAHLSEIRTQREDTSAALAALRSRFETLVFAAPEPASDNRRSPVERGPGADIPETPPPGNPDQRTHVLFAGEASSVTFLAADPGYPARAGLYEYTLASTAIGDDAQTGGYTLVLSRRAFGDLSAFGDGGPSQSWTLLTTDTQPVLSYAPSPGQWRSSWIDQDTLPAQIRIAFGDDSASPAFIVALPAPPPDEPEDDIVGEITQ